ncbi:lysozyme C, milk isozyme-like isoform X1 [Canis lupus familiaris]|uniref:lysozyme C, milk isozyme-like isoform X1 n=1 Tax=Canis lupus familiaris TaxID=9615 RepID=UPI0015F18E8A|nr:lysozyme C, milk isozyme-like isoform X1 [Canis lupus familiaris]
MRSILVITILSYFFVADEAKIFSKCELARKLKSMGMDGFHGYSLANWVCMAEYESNFNTQAFNGRNSNGSSDYGIFQLNSKWWCKSNSHSSANACNIMCSSKDSIPSKGWVKWGRSWLPSGGNDAQRQIQSKARKPRQMEGKSTKGLQR